jgi:hypothetical protein
MRLSTSGILQTFSVLAIALAALVVPPMLAVTAGLIAALASFAGMMVLIWFFAKRLQPPSSAPDE